MPTKQLHAVDLRRRLPQNMTLDKALTASGHTVWRLTLKVHGVPFQHDFENLDAVQKVIDRRKATPLFEQIMRAYGITPKHSSDDYDALAAKTDPVDRWTWGNIETLYDMASIYFGDDEAAYLIKALLRGYLPKYPRAVAAILEE